MLTVAVGIPAPLIVPPSMLSTAPEEDVPSMGAVDDGLVDLETGIVDETTVQLAPGQEIIQIIVGNEIYVWAPTIDDVSPPVAGVISGGLVVTAPAPGTFWYDWETGILTLPSGIPNGTPVTIQAPAVVTLTDLISTIPTPLKTARGAVTIRYQLFSPPSISSVTFVARRASKTALLNSFGTLTAYSIDGHRYYPTQKSIVESPSANSAALAVGFESEFRNNSARTRMDRPVRIKPLTQGSDNNKSYSSFAVAGAAGAVLSGTSIKIRVPKDIDSKASTTLRETLSAERLMVASCFIRLDKGTIDVRNWYSVSTHTISLDELKGGNKAIPAINYNGGGSSINGVPLLVELRGAELKLDKSVNDENGDVMETRVTGDENPGSPPASDMGWYFNAFETDKLRSMNMVFDNGGPTKKKITTELLNGQPVQETEEHYGFVYTSRDVYDYSLAPRQGKTQAQIYFVGGSPDSLWKRFKTVVTTYTFDAEGYLTGSDKVVTQLTRIAKESDQLEEITGIARYEAMSNDGINGVKKEYEARGHWLAGRGLYSFTELSIPAYSPSSNDLDAGTLGDLTFTVSRPSESVIQAVTERNELAPLAGFYDDIETPDEEGDPDWVPPKFIQRRTVLESGTQVIEDPRRSQQQSTPPIVFGKESNQVESIEILSPKDPEKYKVLTRVTNKEGERLQDVATESSFAIQDGRPSIAQRLVQYGFGPSAPSSEDEPNEKYLATTVGLSTPSVATQSISFPGAYTINEAKTALKLWLLIKNLDAATTTVVLNHERPNMRVGDRVYYNGMNWRVKGITNSKEIDASGIPRQVNFTVELGFDFGNIPFTVQTIQS